MRDEGAAVWQCQHVFHAWCIEQWFRAKTTAADRACPVCRVSSGVKLSDLVYACAAGV
jgi:hypothetical protein